MPTDGSIPSSTHRRLTLIAEVTGPTAKVLK